MQCIVCKRDDVEFPAPDSVVLVCAECCASLEGDRVAECSECQRQAFVLIDGRCPACVNDARKAARP